MTIYILFHWLEFMEILGYSEVWSKAEVGIRNQQLCNGICV